VCSRDHTRPTFAGRSGSETATGSPSRARRLSRQFRDSTNCHDPVEPSSVSSFLASVFSGDRMDSSGGAQASASSMSPRGGEQARCMRPPYHRRPRVRVLHLGLLPQPPTRRGRSAYEGRKGGIPPDPPQRASILRRARPRHQFAPRRDWDRRPYPQREPQRIDSNRGWPSRRRGLELLEAGGSTADRRRGS
jgi:hypothetical protein